MRIRMGVNHSVSKTYLAANESIDEKLVVIATPVKKKKHSSQINKKMKDEMLIQKPQVSRFGFKLNNSQQHQHATQQPTQHPIPNKAAKSCQSSNGKVKNENDPATNTNKPDVTAKVQQSDENFVARKSPFRSFLKVPMNILCISNQTTSSHYDLKNLQQLHNSNSDSLPQATTSVTSQKLQQSSQAQITKLPLNKTRPQPIQVNFVQSSGQTTSTEAATTSASSSTSSASSLTQFAPPLTQPLCQLAKPSVPSSQPINSANVNQSKLNKPKNSFLQMSSQSSLNTNSSASTCAILPPNTISHAHAIQASLAKSAPFKVTCK
jgi:hypothetical protein